jgi:hypothetical protein
MRRASVVSRNEMHGRSRAPTGFAEETERMSAKPEALAAIILDLFWRVREAGTRGHAVYAPPDLVRDLCWDWWAR